MRKWNGDVMEGWSKVSGGMLAATIHWTKLLFCGKLKTALDQAQGIQGYILPIRACLTVLCTGMCWRKSLVLYLAKMKQ
jgi:hypothetical protein